MIVQVGRLRTVKSGAKEVDMRWFPLLIVVAFLIRSSASAYG